VISAYGALLTANLLWAHRWLVAVTVLLATATAVYTAFLFGQAKGRDLWQSPLLAPHLLVQALAAGAALFAPRWLLWLLPVNGLLVAAEVWGRHATEDARRAARLIQDDPLFTSGVLALGHLLPLALLWGPRNLDAAAGGLVLLGLLAWEHVYVQAPQRIPLA
jgi:formate-dependent nitrite reductase membrane component NrfD